MRKISLLVAALALASCSDPDSEAAVDGSAPNVAVASDAGSVADGSTVTSDMPAVSDAGVADANALMDARSDDQGGDSIPSCISTMRSTDSDKVREAVCRASYDELADGGPLRLYCSCDTTVCALGDDGVPDRGCAQRMVGQNCDEAIFMACGVRPGSTTVYPDGGVATNDL
ncbi:MAG: hypothetical protein RL385_4009 [Pseudomonadota bacterium]|jgi:hypothetical protein